MGVAVFHPATGPGALCGFAHSSVLHRYLHRCSEWGQARGDSKIQPMRFCDAPSLAWLVAHATIHSALLRPDRTKICESDASMGDALVDMGGTAVSDTSLVLQTLVACGDHRVVPSVMALAATCPDRLGERAQRR